MKIRNRLSCQRWNRSRKWALVLLIAFVMVGAAGLYQTLKGELVTAVGGDYIKWVDYTVSAQAMKKACFLDVNSYGQEVHLDWITLLAYAAVKGGGKFDNRSVEYIEDVAEALTEKETTKEQLMDKYKYFSYYYEAYSAVLGGMLGEYEVQKSDEKGEMIWEKQYGLKAYAPIAKGFPYQDYDDFGASRSFGYNRPHLGHDMMGQVGTPIIAVESGYVEALGWNRYGGWRIGIRSFDKKRYYYYAHLRQNRPYAEGLQEGDIVTAGDVIGYMGHTGYSDQENVNNIKTVHLHVGLQLIFDESQKDCDNEIWVDFYQLAQFLHSHGSEVVRDDATKEWKRSYEMRDPVVEEYRNTHEKNIK